MNVPSGSRCLTYELRSLQVLVKQLDFKHKSMPPSAVSGSMLCGVGDTWEVQTIITIHLSYLYRQNDLYPNNETSRILYPRPPPVLPLTTPSIVVRYE